MPEAPLLKAAYEGDLAGVKARLSFGDDIELRESNETALTLAAYKGNIDIVRLLVDRGADLSATDGAGRTLIALAKLGKSAETAAYLASARQQPRLPAEPTEEWMPMGRDKVAQVGTYPAPMRKLTQLFNFETRERVMIVENLQTRTETVLPPTCFDDLPPQAVEKALDECERLGGTPDRHFALNSGTRLEKPRPRGLETPHG